jgi:hypothetical protein
MKTTMFLFLICVLFITLPSKAQDMIFKKNGEIIKARVLNNIGSSLAYRRFEQKDSTTYFIITTSIDSIIYQSGRKDIFAPVNAVYLSTDQVLNTAYRHQLIGIDLADLLFFTGLAVSYEYLPGKANFGFKVGYAKRLKSSAFYSAEVASSSLNDITDWNFKVGVNYYFFPQNTFRIGTGLHSVFGSYTGYTDPNYINPAATNTKNIRGLLLNGFGFYNITKNLAINLGVDIPLYMNPSAYIGWLQCEIMYNF